jgi:two-component system, NarL family, nitrate/nitrite response regulator NarL
MMRILIVDDYEHIRGMIRALLDAEEGWQVCGEAANGQAAIDQCVLLKPDLVILDIHMPVRNGLEAAREILLRFPSMLILILTIDGSSHFALAVVACGAQGLLVKARAGEDLVTAVSTLLRGERYFCDDSETGSHNPHRGPMTRLRN